MTWCIQNVTHRLDVPGFYVWGWTAAVEHKLTLKLTVMSADTPWKQEGIIFLKVIMIQKWDMMFGGKGR